VHVAAALGNEHTVVHVPQCVASVCRLTSQPSADPPLQFEKFVLHVNPQLVPSQVATAFAGFAHAVHELPQVLVLVLSTQAAPHA